MKRSSLALSTILLASLPAAAGAQAIFRHVQVTGGRVVLGEVMRDKERLGRLVSDTVVALRPEVLGGAEAIKIHLGRGDTVRMMEFEYAPDTDFRATLREYTESLGKPLDIIESSQGTRAFWMDGVTR